jgi:hypothetical protein
MSDKPSLVDLAAHDFMTLLPVFRETLNALSQKKIRRVVSCLFEYPFNQKEFRFSHPEESKAFNIGARLLDCKHVMMKAAFEMTQEEVAALHKEMTDVRGSEEEALVAGGNDHEEHERNGAVRESEGGRDSNEGSDSSGAEPT